MLTKWTTLSLFDLDSGRELKGAERIRKLREYRDTTAMAGVVLVDPTEASSPEDFDALCEAGPAASEIDWTGLECETATITVHDDATPSSHYPTEEQERNGALDYSVTIRVGAEVIESSITLYRDEANGGMGPCGTPIDGWCEGSITEWLRTLDDESRDEAIRVLAGGPGTDEIVIRLADE